MTVPHASRTGATTATTAGAAVPRYAVVVPTLARPTLRVLLGSLAAQHGPLPEEVVVVDDRPGVDRPVDLPDDLSGSVPVRAVLGCGRGPAAARNLGWQLTEAPWVAFLDDDVVLPPGWCEALASDLGAATVTGRRVAGSQGRIVVPLPGSRRPTDWERSTAGLEQARWATADMAYRREALLAVSGFDERFPRAYREDADLAVRVQEAGWSLVRGRRTIVHPVREAPDGMSLRVQRGNIDDALMRRLHGRDWRRRSAAGRGRLPWHAATVAAGLLGLAGTAAGGASTARDREPAAWRRAGACALVGWALLTADFARRRISPGPRDRREVRRMLWTSVAIPPAAVVHRLRGWWRHRGATPWPPPTRAVLFDRDGTLVHDVPYNGDPANVLPVTDAAESVRRLRAHGLRVAVVSNQSGIGRGLLTPAQVRAVNSEVDRQVGPFDSWHVCPHAPEDGCRCRKPRPGLVTAAARHLGVRPDECVVVGDIGADVTAARSAGARSVLVPNGATLPHEVRSAPQVAAGLLDAVDLIVGATRD